MPDISAKFRHDIYMVGLATPTGDVILTASSKLSPGRISKR